MTDKEIFDNNKKYKLDKRRKVKMLKFMKADTNRKILFTLGSEDEKVNLLAELNAIETHLIKLVRNRFNSAYYEYIPSKLKV